MSEERNPWVFIFFIALLVVGYRTFLPHLFDQSIYRGEGFSVAKPVGWQMKKGKQEVAFISSETHVFTNAPVAIFSIYSEKQKGALFMDDLFPQILDAQRREDGDVLGTGDELIDGQLARWIVFRYNNPDIAVVTLYIADDFNRLTRIQFSGSVKKFQEYGKQFDQFKRSIKLKKIL